MLLTEALAALPSGLVSSDPPAAPLIVRVIEQPTKEVGVADVIIQALGLTSVILLAGAVLGVLLGGVFIWFRRSRLANDTGDGAAARPRLNLSAPSR